MLVTSSWILDLSLLFIAVVFFLFEYVTRKFDYWNERGIHNLKPLPFIGNFAEVIFFRCGIAEWMKKIYDSTNEPYIGIFVFDEPCLIIRSPELIKHVMIKDFHNFSDRTMAMPTHNKIMANIMFGQKDPEWRESRTKLSPIFTSGKLKVMFPLIENIGKKLLAYLDKNGGVLEAKELSAKYSTDVIAECFFGMNSHSFDDENATFRQIGRSIFEFTWRNAFVHMAYFFRQNWVHTFKIDFARKWVVDYLSDTFSKILEHRKSNGSTRHDLVDILIEMQKDGCWSDTDKEPEKLIGPAILFFIAGFETTSATISFTLYELCRNRKIQCDLRNEILANIKDYGGITYEGLMEMKYMDMCVKETLRIYPVLPFLDRVCKEDYTLPGTNFVLEKGLPVYVPLFGIHSDEKYFPEPEQFNPNRFLDNKNHKSEGLVYMPFGEGPRACIGERFGMLSTKAALTNILSKFEVEKCPKTPDPVVFEPKSLVLQSNVGLPIIFKRIS